MVLLVSKHSVTQTALLSLIASWCRAVKWVTKHCFNIKYSPSATPAFHSHVQGNCSLKQTARYEGTIHPEGKKKRKTKQGKKRGKKPHLTVVHTCLHGHLLWLGPEVKYYGKYLFSASAISGSASTHCFIIQVTGCYPSLLRYKTHGKTSNRI